ncbi:hypothetical protein, partial [Peptostreptococcus porci]|uniref:hypothetical protein n=1 Tax=Peptostreptococcus porci TaxID=2652282 RepID=UPI002A914B4B
KRQKLDNEIDEGKGYYQSRELDFIRVGIDIFKVTSCAFVNIKLQPFKYFIFFHINTSIQIKLYIFEWITPNNLYI